MCRFTLYLGPPIPLGSLVTEPSNSLIHQSFESREREEPLNGDGFGVAWYSREQGSEPALFRSITPAWNNANLRSIARVVKSHCILAHVRAATQAHSVSEANCHPFTNGRFSFMHNGDVGGFRALRRALLERLSDPAFDAIGGSTDSEHVFALFLDRVRAAGEETKVEDLAGALRATMDDVHELAQRYAPSERSYLNMAVSDGQSSVVTRYSSDPAQPGESLYLDRGHRYVCDGGVCRMVAPDHEHGAVIVSSEPLSKDPGWTKVLDGHMVLIGPDRDVDLRPI